jgi:hypothetical protein
VLERSDLDKEWVLDELEEVPIGSDDPRVLEYSGSPRGFGA